MTTTTPFRYSYNYSSATPHYIQQFQVTASTIATAPKKTQLHPSVHQSSRIGFLFWKLPPLPCAVLVVYICILYTCIHTHTQIYNMCIYIYVFLCVCHVWTYSSICIYIYICIYVMACACYCHKTGPGGRLQGLVIFVSYSYRSDLVARTTRALLRYLKQHLKCLCRYPFHTQWKCFLAELWRDRTDPTKLFSQWFLVSDELCFSHQRSHRGSTSVSVRIHFNLTLQNIYSNVLCSVTLRPFFLDILWHCGLSQLRTNYIILCWGSPVLDALVLSNSLMNRRTNCRQQPDGQHLIRKVNSPNNLKEFWLLLLEATVTYCDRNCQQ